jgi:hypothetical protein
MVFSFNLTYQEKKSILQNFTQLCRPKNLMGTQKDDYVEIVQGSIDNFWAISTRCDIHHKPKYALDIHRSNVTLNVAIEDLTLKLPSHTSKLFNHVV